MKLFFRDIEKCACFTTKASPTHFFSRLSTEFCRFSALFTFFQRVECRHHCFRNAKRKRDRKIVNKRGTWALDLSFFVYTNRFGDVARDFWFLSVGSLNNSRLPAMTQQLRHLARSPRYLKVVLWRHRCFFFQRIVLPYFRIKLVIFCLQSLRCCWCDANQPELSFLRIHFALIQHLFWFLVFVDRAAAKTVLLALAVRLSIKLAF